MIFQSLINSLHGIACRPFRLHSATMCDVTTEQLSNGTVHKKKKKITFHENIIFPLYFCIRTYARAKLIVHAFMIELDQPDY